MKKPLVAHLEIRGVTEGAVPWAGLSVLANLIGVDYRRPESRSSASEDWKRLWEELGALVDEADAFIVRDGPVLAEFSDRLKERVRSGARILILTHFNALSQDNAFLNDFGLAATPYCMVPGILDEPGWWRRLAVPRESGGFLDDDLLQGVDTVSFSSVDAVQFERDAFPVLQAPEHAWAVDRATDRPVSDQDYAKALRLVGAAVVKPNLELPRPSLDEPRRTCIARWEGANGGAVVTLGGNIFWDATRNSVKLPPTPGIHENAVLSANLVRYVAKMGTAHVTPAQYCERAERNLADFVVITLKMRHGVEGWWAEAIPLSIRKECASRQQEEVRKKFPIEAYLTLIDLKTIMEKNWSLFQAHFRDAGETQGKDRALHWIDEFNEVRRMQAHPLKAHIAGYSVTSQDVEIAKQADAKALALLGCLPKQA